MGISAAVVISVFWVGFLVALVRFVLFYYSFWSFVRSFFLPFFLSFPFSYVQDLKKPYTYLFIQPCVLYT